MLPRTSKHSTSVHLSVGCTETCQPKLHTTSASQQTVITAHTMLHPGCLTTSTTMQPVGRVNEVQGAGMPMSVTLDAFVSNTGGMPVAMCKHPPATASTPLSQSLTLAAMKGMQQGSTTQHSPDDMWHLPWGRCSDVLHLCST